jgi:hypothetical protein
MLRRHGDDPLLGRRRTAREDREDREDRHDRQAQGHAATAAVLRAARAGVPRGGRKAAFHVAQMLAKVRDMPCLRPMLNYGAHVGPTNLSHEHRRQRAPCVKAAQAHSSGAMAGVEGAILSQLQVCSKVSPGRSRAGAALLPCPVLCPPCALELRVCPAGRQLRCGTAVAAPVAPSGALTAASLHRCVCVRAPAACAACATE